MPKRGVVVGGRPNFSPTNPTITTTVISQEKHLLKAVYAVQTVHGQISRSKNTGRIQGI
jgi:hypothetical protein